jgi:hypothetical protein
MRDVDSDIRSSLERLTSTTCDTSNVDVLWSDLAVRRRKRRARKGALVAVPLVLVAALAAGVLVDESRREVRTGVAAGGSGDIDADDEAPAVETTSPDAEPEGYTAAQADRWFDELRNVGILQDDSFASDQLRERLRAGQVLVTGTVSGVPSLVRQEMTLPGLEYTGTDELGENGEPASLPTGHRLVLPLTVEGSVEGFALQFELGVDAPGSGHAELVASLAPPPGTRMLFVGDSQA